MARTYSQLRDSALILVDSSTDATDLRQIAQVALEETMKYISQRVELPGLIKSATATWGASTVSIPLGVGGFGITNYDTPNRLYIRLDSTATAPGIPYDFREYLHWLDLSAVPDAVHYRSDSFEVLTGDERPSRCYTIDHSNNLIAAPVAEDNVLTFYYNIAPAAYADSGIPELPAASFDSILVSGAVLVLKEFIREPDVIVDPYTILGSLDKQISQLDSFLNSRRRRRVLNIHSSYRI